MNREAAVPSADSFLRCVNCRGVCEICAPLPKCGKILKTIMKWEWMVYSLEFNAVSGSEAQKRAQQDFDDLQNETAGRDVGRIERFLNGQSNHPSSEKARRKEREAEMSRFMALMSDPVYAKLYEDTGKKLLDTRQFLDDAREQLAALRAKANAEHHDILSRAAHLPDGTLVFRGEDGRAYLRNGELSDDPNAQDIIWRDDQATLAEIQRSDAQTQKIDAFESKLNQADQQLGDMTERYEDTDNPPSTEDLQDMQKRMQDMKEGLTRDLKGLGEQVSPNDAPENAPQKDIAIGSNPVIGLDNF